MRSVALANVGSVEIGLDILPIQNQNYAIYAELQTGGSHDLPTYVIDPKKIDVEVRRVDVPEASSHRLVFEDETPATSIHHESEGGAPADSSLTRFFKPYAVVPGATYEITTTAEDAVSFPKGQAPIDDTALRAPLYVNIRSSDPTKPDPELSALQKTFASSRAVASRPIRALCYGTNDEFFTIPAGIPEHITQIIENYQAAVTGVGATDDHPPTAKNAKTDGVYLSLAPISVHFMAARPNCDEVTVLFASPSDVRAFFHPETAPEGAVVDLDFDAMGSALYAGDGSAAVGIHLEVKEPLGSPPFTANPRSLHIDIRRIGAETKSHGLTAVSNAIVKSKTDNFTDGTFVSTSIAMKPFAVSLGSVYAIRADARGTLSSGSVLANSELQLDTRYVATPAISLAYRHGRYDAEVRRFIKAYAEKEVRVLAPFGAYCTTGDPDGTLNPGDDIRITDQDRYFRPSVTGTGPSGDHPATARSMQIAGSFIALDPIAVTFSLAHPGTGCSAYIGLFSSYADIRRYLAPAPIR